MLSLINPNRIGGRLYNNITKIHLLDVNIALMRQKFKQKLGSMMIYCQKCGTNDLIPHLKKVSGEDFNILPEETNDRWVELFPAQWCISHGLLPIYYDNKENFYFLNQHTEKEIKDKNRDLKAMATKLIKVMLRNQRDNPDIPALNYNMIKASQFKFILAPQHLILVFACYFCTAQ